MKQTGFAVVLSVLVVAVWFGRGGQTGWQGPAAQPPLLCGDVNGDGSFDISDPIYSLLSLFSGGPEPQCLAACNPPLGDVCDEISTLRERVAKLEDENHSVSVRVRRSASLPVESGSTLFFPFNIEDFDTHDMYVPERPTELVVRVPGVYLLYVSVEWQGSPLGDRAIAILLKGGSPGGRPDTAINLAVNNKRAVEQTRVETHMGVMTVYDLQVGDTLELSVFQGSGQTLDVRTCTDDVHPNSPVFGAVRLGPSIQVNRQCR